MKSGLTYILISIKLLLVIIIIKILRMERNTSQKKIIKEYLVNVKNHPSAEEVFLAVQKKLPTISKATVYRILKGFKENGSIQEIISNVSHFDGDLSVHSHFICNRCHKVFDIFESNTQIKFNKNIKAGKIDSYQIYFRGLCNKCLFIEKQSKN